MKKIVLLPSVIAVMLTVFTSCSKDPYSPPQPQPEESAKEKYNKHFRAYIGGDVASNQDWGFGLAGKATTRAEEEDTTHVVMAQKWNAEFDLAFMSTVEDYFPEGKKSKVEDWTSFDFLEKATFHNVRLIYTKTDAADEIGIYYYNPETGSPATAKKIKLIDNVQNGVADYYQYNWYTDIENWANPSPNSGYSIWTGGAKRIRTKPFTVYMNGNYRFGYYVTNHTTGKTYYTDQNLNENGASGAALLGVENVGGVKQTYVVALDDDGKDGFELMLAVAKMGRGGLYPDPGKMAPTPKPQGVRIIAEDLNVRDLNSDGIDDTDFDFNDIVLDVTIDNGKAKCVLQAAGATLKIRINGDDNLEVHKMFGVDQKVMVNTDAEKHGLNGKTLPAVPFELNGTFRSAADIKIEVFRQNGWIELFAPVGQAACKIAVPTDFEWPDERQSLKQKYPDFPRYAVNNDIEKWWENQNK